MTADVCFWLIRRKDTGEYFRPNRGPCWAKCGNWTKDRGRGKAYGKIGAARAATRMFDGNYTPNIHQLELVRFKVVEEGTDSISGE